MARPQPTEYVSREEVLRRLHAADCGIEDQHERLDSLLYAKVEIPEHYRDDIKPILHLLNQAHWALADLVGRVDNNK